MAQAYREPQLWAQPIEDYRQQAIELKFTEFNSAITTLQVHQDQLWMGYGDGNRNLGTPMVIEFRYFADPDQPKHKAAVVRGENQGAPQRSVFDTGEEQIEPFRICEGMICQAGVDSNNYDELWTQSQSEPSPITGNFFRLLPTKSGAPIWEKFRSIPGGEHVHDLAACDGELFAVGSGAANRAEWDEGKVFRYLWKSVDGGQTFEVAYREVCPELGKTDTRYRHLLAVEKTLFAFGFINPYAAQKPRQPQHLKKLGAHYTPLTLATDGKIAEQIVVRTWNLRDDLGLVISRDPNNEQRTNAFLAQANGFRELENWCTGRVIDACWESDQRWLFLVAEGKSPETYSVRRWDMARSEKTELAMDLNQMQPSCLAVWRGQLFLGTQDGKIHRASLGN